ncbi:MAG: 4Fe-4S double cluster binding domain-containing protein [bacterium]
MITKTDVIERATELGFQSIGFTTADPFDSQKEILRSRRDAYGKPISLLDLEGGTDPKSVLPDAKSIIVLVDEYFKESFPPVMEAHFGRCYMDDDRVTRDGLSLRIKAFRSYLRDNGIDSKVPFNIPHRLSAARAGLGSFGKNNFFYSHQLAAKSSWVLPIVIVVDQEFTPDGETIEVGCPDWCKNACIVACPTHAIKSPNKLEPKHCISFLTYYAREITPLAWREPMGLWVFGCDHCQNVCPRNVPARARNLQPNPRVAAKAPFFDLTRLLLMDVAYFETHIWPHMFYIPSKNIWLWKMNVARAIGNTLDRKYVPHLIQAFGENEDERTLGMIAWALGRLGGPEAESALQRFLPQASGLVKEEIGMAIAMIAA